MKTLLDFGRAFIEAAALTWQQLAPAAADEFLRACFDSAQGHGYTLCRVPMGSSDFGLGNYAHVELDGDIELESFSIDHDRRHILPFIHAATRVAGCAPIAAPPGRSATCCSSGPTRPRVCRSGA